MDGNDQDGGQEGSARPLDQPLPKIPWIVGRGPTIVAAAGVALGGALMFLTDAPVGARILILLVFLVPSVVAFYVVHIRVGVRPHQYEPWGWGDSIIDLPWCAVCWRRESDVRHGRMPPAEIVRHRKMRPAEMFVALPPEWQSGLQPEAADEAYTAVRDDPNCIGLAYDASKVGQAYVPNLRVEIAGPGPGGNVAGYLDRQEREFRDSIERDPQGSGKIRSLERVHLPVGEALRLEIVSSIPGVGDVAQVQYYISEHTGGMALWFFCVASDFPSYEATFDQMARTYLRTDLYPDGALQRFARGEITREEFDRLPPEA